MINQRSPYTAYKLTYWLTNFQIAAENNQLLVYQTPSNVPVTVTDQYTPANGNPSYQFMRTSPQFVKARHSSGIIIQMQWLRNLYMNVIYNVPGSLRGSGRIRGLYGNFDGRADNEFATRANPTVPVTSANNNGQEQFNVLNTCELPIAFSS